MVKRAVTASLALLGLLLSEHAFARDYYVAPQGDDEGDGSQTCPFRSIGPAAELAVAGDTVHVAAGLYRETVRPTSSGAVGAPVRFVADVGCVIVNGADPLNVQWMPHAGEIQVASVPTPVTQLFAAGRMMIEARWPNAEIDGLVDAPRAETKPGTDQNGLVDGALPQSDLTAAIVHILPGAGWVAHTRTVLAHDTTTQTLTFDRVLAPTPDVLLPVAGNPYFVFGDLDLLDAPGEWFYDPAAQELYFWPPAGVDVERDLEVKARPWAFDLSGRASVEISGFKVFGAGISLQDAEGCSVDGVHVRYPADRREIDGYATADAGMPISGRDNVWQNGSIAWSSDSGLVVTGQANTVRNLRIHDVTWFGGNGAGVNASVYEGGLNREHLIEGNTISRSTRAGIVHSNFQAGRIILNDVGNVCMNTKDCGAIGTWDTSGEGTEIAFNHVHDVWAFLGMGIYIDDASDGHIIHHNLIHDISTQGVMIKETNHVINNTIARVGSNPIRFEPPPPWNPNQDPIDLSDARIMNNLISLAPSLAVELVQPADPYGSAFAKTFPTATSEIELSAEFSELVHPTWEPPAILDPSTFNQVRLRAASAGQFELWIDEVSLIGGSGTPDFVIDDFEDLDGNSSMGQAWGAYAGGNCDTCVASTIALAIEQDSVTGRGVAHLTGTHSADGWNTFETALVGIQPEQYTGIRVRLRTRGFQLELHAPAGDPQLSHNEDCPLDADFRPLADCGLDQGDEFSPHTDGYAGAAPDLGAFEAGSAVWQAGSDVDEDAAWEGCVSYRAEPMTSSCVPTTGAAGSAAGNPGEPPTSMPPTGHSGSSGGCGCRVPSGSSGPSALGFAALCCVAGLLQRRHGRTNRPRGWG